MKDREHLLFVGPYPPQFGGIASHLSSLVIDLSDDGYDTTTLSPGNFNSQQHVGNVKNIHINLRSYFNYNCLRILLLSIINFRKKKSLSLVAFFGRMNAEMGLDIILKKY